MLMLPRQVSRRPGPSGYFGAIVVVNDTVEAVGEFRFVEIEQQADVQIHQSKMRKCLGFVDWVNGCLGF